MTRLLPIILFSCLFSLNAFADIYSASSALSRGDYATAAAEFKKLAEAGDDRAQANLGYMYYAGEGVPQDYKQAVYWYRKAAVQGNKDAQYNLAVSYAFGEGVKQDLTEAAIWYRRAGEQGHVVSQYSLGISYAYGEGVPQDPKEAARWFKRAADSGYARAQVHLGSMYHTGEGVKQDYAEAVRWYRMAADRGDATAQYNLGTMYRSGKGVEQNYAQAKRWFRQSADQGYAAAQNELASLERSAAANIATRTIQTKPELFPTEETQQITETTTPTKSVEPQPAPKEKIVAEEEIEPVSTPPSTTETATTEQSEKKPLFTVDKKDLLTIDESELDIAKPAIQEETVADVDEVEETIEEPIEPIEPIEPDVDEDVIADVDEIKDDSDTFNRALGIPTTESTTQTEDSEESGGFFSRLFSSKKTETEPELAVAEETTVTETEPVEIETPYQPREEEIVADVDEVEETIEEPIEPIEPIEPDVDEDVIADVDEIKDDSDTFNRALGIPTTESTTQTEDSEESGGFFSRLFSSKKTETEPELAVAEETTVTETEPVEIETPYQPREEEIVADVDEVEETIEEPIESIEPDVDEDVIADTEDSEESGGFFSRLFSSKKTETEPELAVAEETTVTETEPVEIETPYQPREEETVADVDEVEETIEEPIEPIEPIEPDVDEDVIADVDEIKDDSDTFNRALGIPTTESTTQTEDSEESGGFFSRLFSSKKTETEPELAVAEETTVTETEPVEIETPYQPREEEIVADVDEVEETIEEPIESIEPIEPDVDEDVIADTEDSEESGGFFSALGKIFSSKETETDSALNETEIEPETEELLVAKVEEPASVNEEIELAQQVEKDLSEYSVNAGRRALTNNNYDEAVKQFRPLAQAGDSEAQAHLGSMYYVGKGVDQNFNEAFDWYKKAADQGNMDAQYSIGNMYLLGEGVEQDNSDAAKWYALASEQGHTAAKHNLESLKKLEAINRENQLKQEALAKQQGKQESSSANIENTIETTEPSEEPIETVEPAVDESAIADVDETKDDSNTINRALGIPATESITQGDDSEETGGFFSRLFSNKKTEDESELAVAEEEITILEDEPVEIETTYQPEEQEVIIAEVENTDETESTVEQESKPGLLGLLGGLFGGGAKEQPSSELDISADASETAIAEADEQEENDVKTYAAGEAPATQTLQTLDSNDAINEVDSYTDPIDDSTEDEPLLTDAQETENANQVALVEEAETSSESPGFFKRLFGDDNKETVTEEIQTDSAENIANTESTLPLQEEEETDIDTTIEQPINDKTESIAEVTEEEPAESEKSGLLGFFGKMFSSDDKEATEEESEPVQEIALAEPTIDPVSIEAGEVIIEPETKIITDYDANDISSLQPLAIQGDKDAQYKLGTLYYSGNGVTQDYSQAALWYRRAAQQGNVDAQYSLGNMYLMGEGIGQDDRQAAHWYTLAADQGHDSARHNLVNLQKSLAVEQQPETVVPSSDESLVYFEDNAVNEPSQTVDDTGKTEYEQGLAYAFGDGVAQNDRSAFNLFLEAAEKGYALAQYKVGVAYAYGEGVRQDNKKAAEWYRKAAEQGYTIAQRNLATMYLNGNGIEQDKVQALAWYQVVANNGNAMDIRRRDMLQKELSEVELSKSEELANQITIRLNSNASL